MIPYGRLYLASQIAERHSSDDPGEDQPLHPAAYFISGAVLGAWIVGMAWLVFSSLSR